MRSFCALFPNRNDTSIRSIEGLDWRGASRFYTLSDQELIESIARASKVLRAVFAGEQCRFAVLTFVSGGDFFTLAKLAEVKEALKRLGINKTVLYRASGSEDWQLFIYFSDWITTSEVRSAFSRWLSQAGLAYSQSLLLYPGSELPMPLPLQVGFAWLNDQGLPTAKREDLTQEQAVEMFLNDMADNGNPWEAVSRKFSNPFLRALPKQSDAPTQTVSERGKIQPSLNSNEFPVDELAAKKLSAPPADQKAREIKGQLSLFPENPKEQSDP